MKRFHLLSIILLFALKANSQTINYSYHLSGPSPESYDSDKYIFIDFWATWCIPCIKSMDHIEHLQSVYSDKVFFASITAEQPQIVEKFLRNRSFTTSILLDYQSENFNMHEITAIPRSILIDNNGRIIWKGHPSDMSLKNMGELVSAKLKSGTLQFNHKHIPSEKEDEIKYEPILVKKLIGTDTIHVALSPYNIDNNKIYGDAYLFYQGSLISLVAGLLEVGERHLKFPSELNEYLYVRIPLKLYQKHPIRILEAVESHFNFTLVQETRQVEAMMIHCDSSTQFMDNTSFDFGGEVNKLISSDAVEADNMTCDEFSLLLSDVLDKPVIFINAPQGVYDWNLHYRYENLMLDQLQYDYNTRVENKLIDNTYYHARIDSN